MSKLAELLAELADEEGIEAEDLEALVEAVKRRKKPSAEKALARSSQEEPPVEFPVGPNHARAITRREGNALDTSQANRRGVAMYGDESSREAYARWMDQEQNDPEGVYGPGGGSAGGIFGDAPVTMPDYDPTAHRRTDSAQGGVAMARLSVVLERLIDRMDSLEGRGPSQALPGGAPRRLRGKR